MIMKTVINIKERENAIKDVDAFRKKKYEGKDVRFTNVNLLAINKLIDRQIFRKNDLFINSETLWELTQPIGCSGTHNYHELTPGDIVDALNSITDPYALFETKRRRYAIITTTMSHFEEPLMAIIEVGASLILNSQANINKVVTIYPKSNVDIMLNGLDKKDVLFIKK